MSGTPDSVGAPTRTPSENEDHAGRGCLARVIGSAVLRWFRRYGTETLVLSPELVMVKVPEAVEA